MSREIKFRAYTFGEGLKKSMCRVKKIDFSDGEITCEHDYKFKFGEFKLMQYTGLKDCKGKEIYESDILKGHGGYVGRVRYNSSYGRFEIKIDKTTIGCEWQIDDSFPLTELNINGCEYKAIGNIYENSELLK